MIDFKDRDRLESRISDEYVAEYCELLPGIIRVFAPCGCIQTIQGQDSVLTGCMTESCSFSWDLAAKALLVLNLGVVEVVDSKTKPDLTVN